MARLPWRVTPLGRNSGNAVAVSGAHRLSSTIAQQIPNSGAGGRARSARQSPSQRRPGNQNCGKPQAAARRRCSPVLPGARRPRRRAAGAPTRQRRSVRSLGEAGAACRASRPPGCPRNSSRRCTRRMGPTQRFRATRPQGSPLPCSSPFALCGSWLALSHTPAAGGLGRGHRGTPCKLASSRAAPCHVKSKAGRLGVRALTAAALARYMPPYVQRQTSCAAFHLLRARRQVGAAE
jgi:hypothetical protein